MKKPYLLLALAFVWSMMSCENDNIISENSRARDPLVQKLIDLGFRAEMIEEYDDHFVVEDDIVIRKEDLQGLSKVTQAATQFRVEQKRVMNVTVRIDNSMPTTGVDNWGPQIQQAINDWNGVPETKVRLVLTTSTNADITVRADNGVLSNNTIADAQFPTSNGLPGNRIRVNLDFLSNMNVSNGQKRYNMVHELGHCIGLRHTNWSARGEDSAIHIPGTPSTDPNSVMNGGTALNTWAGFSNSDRRAVQVLYPSFFEVGGVGWEAQGAGVVIANIGGNQLPDMVLVAYDNPPGANEFRYRIGYDLINGVATSWSGMKRITGVSWEAQGADVAIANVGGNYRPDLILMAYDSPSGANEFRYKIGWDLNSNGDASGWSNIKRVAGVGWEGQGASVAIANIGGTSRPDIVLMAYDAPSGANEFRYKIGYDLNTSGDASSWSNIKNIAGVGWEGQGASVALVNIGGTSRPDMVLMAYDNPPNMNEFRYKIGWDLNTSGNASNWSSMKRINGVGWEAQGAGVVLAQLSGSSRPDMILTAYDNPSGGNTFRYRFGRDLNTSGDAASWDNW